MRTARRGTQDDCARQRMLNRRRQAWRREPFQREHELAGALLTLAIATTRYGSRNDNQRLALLQHVIVLLAHEVGERVEHLHGKDAAKALRKSLARRPK